MMRRYLLHECKVPPAVARAMMRQALGRLPKRVSQPIVKQWEADLTVLLLREEYPVQKRRWMAIERVINFVKVRKIEWERAEREAERQRLRRSAK